MAHGGKRNGSGRRKGSGSTYRVDQEVRKALIAEGSSPLQVMQALIKRQLDEGIPDESFLLDVCKAAAPYVHAKMHDSKVQGQIEIVHVPNIDKL